MRASIIIIAYNVEKYIDRCIISAINQSEKDIDIVIVNDGSTDKTLKIIKDISKNDTRINIINKTNEGVIEARKSGLKAAQGEYILFLDGDDWLELDCIEKLYNSAKKTNCDVVLYNIYNSFDNMKERVWRFDETYLRNNLDHIKNILLDKISPTMWDKFIRKDFILNNNIEFPSSISFAEDLATITNILINKPKLEFNNSHLYNYYHRNDSITRNFDSKILHIDKAIEFIKEKLIENRIYDIYKNEFEYMIFLHILISKILETKVNYKQRREVYKQFKLRKIDLNKNKYIHSYLSNVNKNFRLRINLYNFSYELGLIIDLLKGFI